MRRRIIPYDPKLKEIAKALRKSMTYSEVRLWNRLKNFQMMGYDFDRQRPMLNYVTDFYCKDLLLVIEVDGITHHDGAVFLKDEIRDEELKEYGVAVLRFNALDVVHKIEMVLKSIENWILDFKERKGVPELVKQRRIKKT
ncbi:MAG: endonuclease domain-containing protein [Bacteroidota bacterium]